MNVRPSIIILQNRRILLMRYSCSGKDVYGLPGGNPDQYETLENTLIRELQEELNVDVKITGLAFVGEVIFREKGSSTLHCVFRGQISSGAPVLNPAQTTALSCEWLSLEEAASVNMYPNIGKFIKELLSGDCLLGPRYIGQIEQKWF